MRNEEEEAAKPKPNKAKGKATSNGQHAVQKLSTPNRNVD